MSKDWYEHFGNEQHRGDFVASELARLKTAAPEDPAIIEQKKRQAAETLRRHDRLFGAYWGCSLGVPAPAFEAGDDPEARPD
jgi:predicted N-acyltransferase